MITFTQSEDRLVCSSPEIGNQYSDLVVSVNLTDDTFTNFDYIGLYICNPCKMTTYRSAVLAGKARIDHEALNDDGDIYVALCGYSLSGGQLTTNSVGLIVNRSSDPSKYDPIGDDWKQSTSDKLIREATAKAVKEYLEEHGIYAEIDSYPTAGSTNPVSSGGVFSALNSMAAGLKSTGANYIRLGGVMVCFGSFKLDNITISTADGNNFYDFVKQERSDGPLADTGGFPVCFTSTPSVWVFSSGLTSRMWTGHSNGTPAGIKSFAVFRSTASNGTAFTGRYIAIGRCDGERKGGAAVITEALKWLGRSDSVGTQILDEYNSFALDNIQTDYTTGWCSEFASVCAHRAKIPTNIFPYFAGGPRGSKKFSDIGCFYKLSGRTFKKAIVTDNSKDNYSYTLGTETYIPQLGDVLWTSSGNDYPRHTGIIITAATETVDNEEMVVLYTIEGNLTNEDDESANGRTVKFMRRVVGGSATRDRNIFAIGRVNYPADYKYADEAGSSFNPGGGSDDGSGDSGNTGEFVGGSMSKGGIITLDGVTITTDGNTIIIDGASAAANGNAIVLGDITASGSGGESSGGSGNTGGSEDSGSSSGGSGNTGGSSGGDSGSDSGSSGGTGSVTINGNAIVLDGITATTSGNTIILDGIAASASGNTILFEFNGIEQPPTDSGGDSGSDSGGSSGGTDEDSGGGTTPEEPEPNPPDPPTEPEPTKDFTYTISNVADAQYGFASSNGYYVSQNHNIDNSYAICRVTFHVARSCDIAIEVAQENCEKNYDYGIIGSLNQTLSRSINDDSGVKLNLKGTTTTSQILIYNAVPVGDHYIEIKYRKDNSQSTEPDVLKFRVLDEVPDIPEDMGFRIISENYNGNSISAEASETVIKCELVNADTDRWFASTEPMSSSVFMGIYEDYLETYNVYRAYLRCYNAAGEIAKTQTYTVR